MFSNVDIAIAAYLAYLFGSISSAILVCKVMGLPDPRTQGSRNPGATNVLRIGGKSAALITLLGDMLKGTLPVLAAKWYGLHTSGIALVAFAAFIGHLFPIFFQFEGGKGVATSLGCLFALSWPVGLCWLGTWLIVALVFRFASLASLAASLFSPIYIWYFTHNLTYVFTITFMTVLLFIRHKDNISNLLTGRERTIRMSTIHK